MSLLKSNFQRSLTEGQYTGTIVGLEEVEAHIDTTGKKINSYVTIKIKLDDGRDYSCNLFERGFRYAVLNVAEQLGIMSAVLPCADEILMNAHVKFSIVKNVVDDVVYYNVDFRAWEDFAPAEDVPEFEVAR